MRHIKGQSLTAGNTFSVVAPSSCVERKLLIAGEKKAKQFGYYLSYTPQIFKRLRYMAGPEDVRIDDLVAAARDTETRAIWCARGGVGATRLLPYLDRMRFGSLLQKRRKLLIGYSDITALHSYAWQKAKLSSVHAPLMATPSWLNMKPKAVKDFLALLAGQVELGKKSYTCKWPTKFLSTKQSAEGVLLGGNLSVLCALVGTPWQPSFRNGLLFLEDIAEPPYRLDRMLNQMHQAGCFKGLKGLVLGDLEQDVPKFYLKKTHWREVILDHFAGMKIPILKGIPAGHGPRNEALPLGVQACITSSGKLELLEQVTSHHY